MEHSHVKRSKARLSALLMLVPLTVFAVVLALTYFLLNLDL